MSGHRLRHWHRWLGMGSLFFVVLLSVTGIVLNHSGDLRLDQRYVRAPWILNWYGIEVPAVESSYGVGEHRVTLLGERLYFDEQEFAEGIVGLTGAVVTSRFIVVATPDSVLLLTRGGELIERMTVGAELPGAIEAVGDARTGLVVRSEGALYRADEEFLGFDPCTDITGADVEWSELSDVPPRLLSLLHDAYRGAGVTVERFLADLHSGRLFTAAGPVVMDIVGVILIALSVFGIMLWVRGNAREKQRTPPETTE